MAFLSAFPCRNSDTSSLSLALFHHFPVPVQPLGLVRLLLGNTIGKGLRPVGHTFNIGSPRGTHVVLWLCCGWERQGAKHLPLAIERYRPTGARRGPGPPSGRVFYAPPCRRAPARPARPGFRLLWPGFGSGLDPVFKGFASMMIRRPRKKIFALHPPAPAQLTAACPPFRVDSCEKSP